jgi:hypothetical protein
MKKYTKGLTLHAFSQRVFSSAMCYLRPPESDTVVVLDTFKLVTAAVCTWEVIILNVSVSVEVSVETETEVAVTVLVDADVKVENETKVAVTVPIDVMTIGVGELVVTVTVEACGGV